MSSPFKDTKILYITYPQMPCRIGTPQLLLKNGVMRKVELTAQMALHETGIRSTGLKKAKEVIVP